MFADRITISWVTGFSPYQLLHTTKPFLLLDLAEAIFLVEEFCWINTVELLALHAHQITKHPEDVKCAAETLHKAQFSSKRQFELRFLKKIVTQKHEAGDLVLMHNTSVETSHSQKQESRYLGPYEVARQTAKDNYWLLELDGTSIKDEAVAAFRILLYISQNHSFMWNNQLEEEDEETDPSDSDQESD